MKRIAIGLLALLAALAAYFGSPFFALSGLQQAAKTGDRDQLEEKVDFPAVRESLKAQFNTKIMTEMQNSPEMKDNPFAALGLALAPVIVERAVEAYVTPESIAALVKGQKPDVSETPANAAPTTAAEQANAAQANGAGQKTKTDYQYLSLDRFKTTYASEGDPSNKIALVFERRNILAWKLIRIDLPMDAIAATPQETSQ